MISNLLQFFSTVCSGKKLVRFGGFHSLGRPIVVGLTCSFSCSHQTIVLFVYASARDFLGRFVFIDSALDSKTIYQAINQIAMNPM